MLQWLKDQESSRSEVTLLSHEKMIWVHLQSYKEQPAAHVMSQRTFCAQNEGARVMARASDITRVLLTARTYCHMME